MSRLVVLLFLFLVLPVSAQDYNISFSPRIAAVAGGCSAGTTGPLMDAVTGNERVAFSVRLLTTAYAGNAMQVTRASDSTSTVIGYSAGNLDTASLSTFCSATDCYVTIWYDQSGNGFNFSQSDTTLAPLIVKSGTILTGQGGFPRIQFDGNEYMQLATGGIIHGDGANTWAGHVVGQFSIDVDDVFAAMNFNAIGGADGRFRLITSGSVTSVNTYHGAPHIFWVSQLGLAAGGVDLSIDGAYDDDGNTSGTVSGTSRIGVRGGSASPTMSTALNGYLQEFVTWRGDHSALQENVCFNTNDYFNFGL